MLLGKNITSTEHKHCVATTLVTILYFLFNGASKIGQLVENNMLDFQYNKNPRAEQKPRKKL